MVSSTAADITIDSQQDDDWGGYLKNLKNNFHFNIIRGQLN